MRVAFLNRPHGQGRHGGDLVQMDATMSALRQLGVDCDYNPKSLRDYDIAHIFHCNFDWSRQIFYNVERSEIPYVVTPIYYPANYGMTAEEISKALSNAKAVFPFSQREADELPASANNVYCVPNGTELRFHCYRDAMQREGVLCVSVDREGKGIDLVEEACKIAGLPFTYINNVGHDSLPDIYKKHRVFVNASVSERMSLTIGEALCAGCRVLATSANRGNEWYPEIETINPHMSADDLAKTIEWVYTASVLDYAPTVWNYTPNEAARKLTWFRTASDLLVQYTRILCSYQS